MRMKAGSLRPPFTMTLKSAGAPLEGLDEAASVVMVGVQGVTEVFRDTDPTIDAEAATVTHAWVGAPDDDTPGETDTPGRIFVTCEVDLGDGQPIIFPPFGELAVDIEA
jgi:hypothetical protein